MDVAKQLFESLAGVAQGVSAALPGLKGVVAETMAEANRLGKHGESELASALFSGSAFVQYGPANHTPAVSQEHGAHEHGRSR